MQVPLTTFQSYDSFVWPFCQSFYCVAYVQWEAQVQLQELYYLSCHLLFLNSLRFVELNTLIESLGSFLYRKITGSQNPLPLPYHSQLSKVCWTYPPSVLHSLCKSFHFWLSRNQTSLPQHTCRHQTSDWRQSQYFWCWDSSALWLAQFRTFLTMCGLWKLICLV